VSQTASVHFLLSHEQRPDWLTDSQLKDQLSPPPPLQLGGGHMFGSGPGDGSGSVVWTSRILFKAGKASSSS
jgi:hypothetical protein